jgi:6-phosphogluconolactonase
VQTGQGGGGCVLVQPVAGGAVSSRPLVPAETATPLISAALWQPNGQVSLVATVAVANNPYIFLDPRERFAYVFNGGTSSNLVCRIMPDGTLFTISTAVTTSGPTFSNSGKFVYLGNSSYLLDPVSGAYTSGVGPTGTFSESFIVFDPYDRFAWSTNNGTSLYSATVNPLTGALTQSGSTITAAGTQFAWMAVDPSGRYLYVTDALNAYLYAYSINQTTGALTSLSGSPYTLTASSKSVDVDPSGNFVFVNYASAAQVQAFKITPSTGALAAAAGGAVTGPTSAAKLICDRSGKFLFVAGSSQLYCYSYDGAGLLTLIGSQVLVGSPNFIDLKITASNRYLYVANYANASYQIFALQRKGVTDIDTSMSSGNVKMISGHTYVGPLLPQDLPKTPVASLPGATSTGALSTITAAISSPNYPQNPATDRSGSYLYVAGFGSSNIAMYSINQTTGALTALTTPTVSTVSGPVGTCFAKTPFGSFVYVGSNTAASISGYSQDPATGQLTAISGSPFTDLAVVTMIYVDATSRFLYAVHGYSSTGITVYAINQTTGALTYIATTPVLSGSSYGISGDPTGQFIFYTTSSLLVGFTVNQATGNLTLVNSVTVGTVSGASYSSGMVCTAKGYIYTHSKDSNLVYVSSFNPLTGTLTLLSSQAYTGNLLTWTASPDGNFVYAGDYANALYTGWRVGSSGALTALATIVGGSNPNGVVVDPSGRFLYGANYAATGIISQYSVNSSLTLPSNINYAATPQSFIARSVLAASANAVVATIPSTAYAEIKIIDNKSNIVYYGLYAGTLTQITTNANYSVTSTPGAAAFGLAYASGAVSIYAGSGATSYSWAAFVSVTT